MVGKVAAPGKAGGKRAFSSKHSGSINPIPMLGSKTNTPTSGSWNGGGKGGSSKKKAC